MAMWRRGIRSECKIATRGEDRTRPLAHVGFSTACRSHGGTRRSDTFTKHVTSKELQKESEIVPAGATMRTFACSDVFYVSEFVTTMVQSRESETESGFYTSK
jgi:hypothetical protein